MPNKSKYLSRKSIFKNLEAIEINLFSPLGITISLVLTIPIFAVMIFATYFPESWNATILKLGLARGSDTTARPTYETTSSSENKTVEWTEVFDTPVGILPVIKYTNDTCLYASATTAHTNYYGAEELKSQLKVRYQVQCILWN